METTSDYDKEKLQERVSKLAGEPSPHMLTASEVEMKEKKTVLTMHYTQLAQR
jgi:hypothetical protein